MRKVALNYTTFGRDLDWLHASLQSFRKHASGFSEVVIVVPTYDLDRFMPFEKLYGTPECPVLVKQFIEMPNKGFIHHLAMKCYADVYSPSADLILHMDPDCLFSKPVTPDDYMVRGKPVLVIESYDEIKKYHEARYHWKEVTEMAVRFNTPYETMCRHPALHYKSLYKATRDHIEALHHTPFLNFVLMQQNRFPQGFGEFNTLGAIAYEFYKDRYHFHDRGDKRGASDPEPKVWQGWSYTGVHAPDNASVIRSILSQ